MDREALVSLKAQNISHLGSFLPAGHQPQEFSEVSRVVVVTGTMVVLSEGFPVGQAPPPNTLRDWLI